MREKGSRWSSNGGDDEDGVHLGDLVGHDQPNSNHTGWATIRRANKVIDARR